MKKNNILDGIKINLLALISVLFNFFNFIIETIIGLLTVPFTTYLIGGGLFLIALIALAVINPNMILTIILVGVIVYVIFCVISAILSLVTTVLFKLLSKLRPVSILISIANKYKTTIINYIERQDYSSISNFEKVFPFILTIVIHYLLKVLKIIVKAIAIIVYPFIPFGTLVVVIVHDYSDKSSTIVGMFSILAEEFKTADTMTCVSRVIFISLILILGTILAHAISSALRSALKNAMELDDFFCNFIDAFRVLLGKEAKYYKEKYENNQENCEENIPNSEENPYYEILSKASDSKELKSIYHKYLRLLHPDISELDNKECTKKTSQLIEAYTELKKKYES